MSKRHQRLSLNESIMNQKIMMNQKIKVDNSKVNKYHKFELNGGSALMRTASNLELESRLYVRGWLSCRGIYT